MHATVTLATALALAACASQTQAPTAPAQAPAFAADAIRYADYSCGQGHADYCDYARHLRELYPEASAAAGVPLVPPSNDAPAIPTVPDTIIHVPLTRTDAGVFTLWATINGSAPINFMLDTGASVVVLPRWLAQQLADEGRITGGDYTGSATATLADGSQTRNAKYLLHSVEIGGIELPNITCVIDEGGAPLLGQAVLSKFHHWSIDNAGPSLEVSS